MKSANGPTRSRPKVLARENSLTCVAVAMAIEGIPDDNGDDGGSDSTMVPMFDITISHYQQ
jgi:hypothetical protein